MVEFLNSLAQLGKENPLALLMFIMAVLVLVLLGGVGIGWRYLDYKNKRQDEKAESEKRRGDQEQQRSQWHAGVEEKRLTALTQMAEALINQSKQQGQLVGAVVEGGLSDREKTKVLEETKKELAEQGDVLDTLQAMLVGQKSLLEKHRVEVAPTLEEITAQGKRLAETNKLLVDLRDTVKTLPGQVKTEIAPDLNDLIKQLAGMGAELRQLVADFDETSRTILEVITRAMARLDVPGAPPVPEPLIVPVPSGEESRP